MNPTISTELFGVATDKTLTETGGGHNAKGIDFQRYWAIIRMCELEELGENDFLFLFEAIQDIAILNSTNSPTEIRIYQVKKKDRNEWSWAALTNLNQPENPSKPPKKIKAPSNKPAKLITDVQDSPLGKLYASVRAFKLLKSTGVFLSNAGCDLPLANGANAATSLPSVLSDLSSHYVDLLTKGLATFHKPGEPNPNLSQLGLQRVSLSVDDPNTHVVGTMNKFLSKRSIRHAGQASAFVEALITKIAPLTGKTDTCKSFNEIRKQHGYSRDEFIDDLAALEELPNVSSILDNWLNSLAVQGMDFFEVTKIRIAAAAIYRRQVSSFMPADDIDIISKCDTWLMGRKIPNSFKIFLEEGYKDLQPHAFQPKPVIMAHLALRAIKICMDHSSGNSSEA